MPKVVKSKIAAAAMFDEGRDIGIDNQCAVGAKAVGNSCFFLYDGFDRAEKFHMCGIGIGNQGDIGLGDLCKLQDFAGGIGAEFYNGDVVVGVKFKKRKRQADIVIETFFGLMAFEMAC